MPSGRRADDAVDQANAGGRPKDEIFSPPPLKPAMGNKNPVTLVAMVVVRNRDVMTGLRFSRYWAISIIRPETMPTKLKMT